MWWVSVSDPDDNIRFSSYLSVVNEDPFLEPEKLLNVPWLAPLY